MNYMKSFAFFVALSTMILCSCGKGNKINKLGGQSPIKVMGGSIRIRSLKAWSPNVPNCTGCLTASADTSQIVFDDTDAAQSTQNLGNQPWRLEIDARDQAGSATPTHRGILICTNYNGNGECSLNGTRNSNVTVIPVRNDGSTSLTALPYSDYGYGFSYHDLKCAQPCSDPREDLGRIYLNSDTKGVLCNNGECRVYIGQ
jgi:hypothetical protein